MASVQLQTALYQELVQQVEREIPHHRNAFLGTLKGFCEGKNHSISALNSFKYSHFLTLFQVALGIYGTVSQNFACFGIASTSLLTECLVSYWHRSFLTKMISDEKAIALQASDMHRIYDKFFDSIQNKDIKGMKQGVSSLSMEEGLREGVLGLIKIYQIDQGLHSVKDQKRLEKALTHFSNAGYKLAQETPEIIVEQIAACKGVANALPDEVPDSDDEPESDDDPEDLITKNEVNLTI